MRLPLDTMREDSASVERITLSISGRMPGLNELIDAKGVKGRQANHAYRRLKGAWSQLVKDYCRLQGVDRHRVERARFVFRWREPDRRRDLDNVAAGGRKIILDALVEVGILPGDGWAVVEGWEDHFTVDRENPGVDVEIIVIR